MRQRVKFDKPKDFQSIQLPGYDLICSFFKEIEASYRMNEEFIPIDRCLSATETLGYQWRSLTR